jgi:hypothetical protein
MDMQKFDPSQYMTLEEFVESVRKNAIEESKKLRVMLENSKKMRLKYKKEEYV